MGADKTLIEGAYAAAGGGIDRTGHISALSEMSTKITDKIVAKADKRKKDFQAYMNWELNRDPGMNEEERKQLYKELQKKRLTYITGTGEDRAMLMGELADNKAQYEELDALKKTIAAKSNSVENGFADNTEWMGSVQGESVYQAMQGAPIKSEDGKWGYMIKDNEGGESFMTFNELDQLVKEQSFDSESNTLLHGMTYGEMQKSSKLSHASNPQFEYDQAYMKVKAQVNRANIRSLVEDEHIPGRTFKSDLSCMLDEACEDVTGGVTYQDLGITEDMLNVPGVDVTDGIQSDEAATIVDALTKNEGMVKKYLTTYFTNYVQQNWEAAAKNRKDYVLTEEQREKKLEEQIVEKVSGDKSPDQEGKESNFDQAFASHRAKMIQEHGMDYSKWTDFEFGDKKYHPFTKDDESANAHEIRMGSISVDDI